MIEISGPIEYSTGVEYSTCDTPYNPFFQGLYGVSHVEYSTCDTPYNPFFKVFYKIECIYVGFEISRYPFGVKTHLGVFFWKNMLIGRFLAGIGRI